MTSHIRAGVAQLGARMHYAVPEAFANVGWLEQFCTDLWLDAFPFGISDLLARFSSSVAARQSSAIPTSIVHHIPILAIAYAVELRRAKTRSDETRIFLKYSSHFAKACIPFLKGKNLIYGFNSAMLELLESPALSAFTVLEQTLVPRKSEQRLLADLPGREHDRYSNSYEEREAKEWDLASLIVCGSDFVRTELLHHGVPDAKIAVIPYGYGSEPPIQPPKTHRENEPIRLLFVGNGALRKGLPDLLDAIRPLGNRVQLTVAGQLQLPDSYSLNPSDNVVFSGSVPRSKMKDVYRKHDVFVLPSLCEGSATVTYEALHYGLPVICTPNTGSVVTDLFDGRIVGIQQPKALREAIEWFLESGTLEETSFHALQTASQFTAASYGTRLVNEIERRFSPV